MTSTDRVAVSHLLHELATLRDALQTLSNPLAVVDRIQRVIHMVSEPPPGNPGELRELAGAFRRAGRDTSPLAQQIGDLGTQRLPEVWRGSAGATAAQVVTATGDLLGALAPAFAVADTAIEEYADTVERLRRLHADLHQQLYDAWHQLSHALAHPLERSAGQHPGVPGLDVIDDFAVARARAVALVSGCLQVFQESLDAADQLGGRLADVTGRARSGVNRRAQLTPANAVLLADAAIGGGIRGDNVILTPAQAERVGDRRALLTDGEQVRLDGILEASSSPQERGYLLKAFAAGHSLDELHAFGTHIHGRDPDWLRQHLSLLDPGQPGAVTFNGANVEQFDHTTCGATSIVVARAMIDPVYSLQLTAGGDPDAPAADSADAFTARLKAEEQRLHDSTNTLWPQRLGTTPWGVSGALNAHADAAGTGYDWHVVDDTDDRSVNPALHGAVAAVDQGYPVPVLIGDSYPQHYVLLVGHDGSDLLFYQPEHPGEVVRVGEQDFRNGNMSALGYRHVQAVITPTR